MEQALVFASIVLGIGVAFELENLNRVLRSKMVKWHWAQPLFALFVLLTIISYWWAAARNSEGSITLAQFLPIMLALILLVLLAAVSLPDKVDEKGVDLAQYYQDNCRYQWILMSLFFWSVNFRWFAEVWQQGLPFLNFVSVVATDVIAGLLIVAMIFIKRWWMIAIAYCILALGPIVWLGRSLG